MITRLIWTIWTSLSAVPRKAVKFDHSLPHFPRCYAILYFLPLSTSLTHFLSHQQWTAFWYLKITELSSYKCQVASDKIWRWKLECPMTFSNTFSWIKIFCTLVDNESWLVPWHIQIHFLEWKFYVLCFKFHWNNISCVLINSVST